MSTQKINRPQSEWGQVYAKGWPGPLVLGGLEPALDLGTTPAQATLLPPSLCIHPLRNVALAAVGDRSRLPASVRAPRWRPTAAARGICDYPERPLRRGSGPPSRQRNSRTERRFTHVTQLIRSPRSATGGRRHCAAPGTWSTGPQVLADGPADHVRDATCSSAARISRARLSSGSSRTDSILAAADPRGGRPGIRL
jgi:hypothetical protein